MVNVALEIVLHKVVCKFFCIAQTLKATVHVACISKIFEADNTFPPSVIFLFQVKFFKSDRSSSDVILLEFTFGFVVFPVFL